jgi:hypothetical protein
MWRSTVLFPSLLGPYMLPQLVASAASLEAAAVPQHVSVSWDGWQGSACLFS